MDPYKTCRGSFHGPLQGLLQVNMSLDLPSQSVKAKLSKCIEFFCLGLSMRISLQMTSTIQNEPMY